MVFNSVKFAVFFFFVYSLYLVLDHKRQNRMLLVANYIFYGSWNWKFLGLLLISTTMDYFFGIKIHEQKKPAARKRFLIASVAMNLGFLGIFKYFNFFTHSFHD